MNEFIFDENIIFPDDPTATKERIRQYKDYYKVKYDICLKQNPKLIVEIGVRCGYSAWTFLQACPNAHYIGIDANNGMHGGKGGEDGRYFRWAEKILKGYSFQLLQIDTQKIDKLDFDNINFFHVDGDHTKEGVEHDLTLAYNHIAQDGLILVDDYTYLDSVKLGVDAWFANMWKYVSLNFRTSLRGEILIRKII